MDHVNGDGAVDRAANGGIKLALVLADPERYQLLCSNDNHRKRIARREFRPVDTYRRADHGLDGEKRCPRCEQVKPLSEWYRNTARSSGVSVYCIPCFIAAEEQRNTRLRHRLLNEMGERCVDCGETDIAVLCIDHVQSDGHAERLLASSIVRFAKKVLAEPERYAIRCFNCNEIKRAVLGEWRQPETYTRKVPSERIKGPGKGRAPGQQDAMHAWWADATPEQRAEMAKRRASRRKGIPNAKVAEARRGTKLVNGRWVRPSS